MRQNAIQTARVKDYLRSHPNTDYATLVKELELEGALTRPNFYAMRNRAKAGEPARKPVEPAPFIANPSVMTVEILAETDSKGFSNEIKAHYQSHILPLLKRVVPGGGALQLVFHSDPEKIEVRRLVK